MTSTASPVETLGTVDAQSTPSTAGTQGPAGPTHGGHRVGAGGNHHAPPSAVGR